MTTAISVRDSSFKTDISKLTKLIKDNHQKEGERREVARLSGLRGVLKLAVRKLSTIGSFSNEDLNRINEWLSSPQNFMTTPDTLPATLAAQGFDKAEVRHDDLLLNGVQYRAIRFKDNLHLQIGIRSRNEGRRLISIYEQLNKHDEARILITAFRDYPCGENFLELLNCLREPQYRAEPEYRLPYISLFFCQSHSDEISRQTYMPYGKDSEVDTDTFAKLFELSWIGSRPLRPEQLRDFHAQLIEDFEQYEIIHAMEYPIPEGLQTKKRNTSNSRRR